MFTFTLIIGLYAYTIFFLGIFKQLYFTPILITTIIFLSILIIKTIPYALNPKPYFPTPKTFINKFLLFLILNSYLLILVIATLPETAFDSIWYHLTLPKIYLLRHSLVLLQGNLLHYSGMPQLTEMLYIPALLFSSEITAKVLHAIFGFLTTLLIYLIGKKYFSIKIGLLASLMFISDLSVTDLASTSYIDLARSFFEISSFYCFLKWWHHQKNIYLLQTGILTGLAIATKTIALPLITIYVILILLHSHKKILSLISYFLSLIPLGLPFYLRAFILTKNPFYPLFTNLVHSSTYDRYIYYPTQFITDFIDLAFHPTGFTSAISPLFILLLPLVIYYSIKKPHSLTLPLSIYAIIFYIFWFIMPRTSGSRFFVPLLPILALLYSHIANQKIPKAFAILVISLAAFNLSLRVYLNKLSLPYLIGKESKHEYLIKRLNFQNTIYDTDNQMQKLIGQKDIVMIIGSQHLYYTPFNFTHITFQENLTPTHILTQNEILPPQYTNSTLIYSNNRTGINLYRL